MVHVVDATGQRTRLTDDLRLIPVSISNYLSSNLLTCTYSIG